MDRTETDTCEQKVITHIPDKLSEKRGPWLKTINNWPLKKRIKFALKVILGVC